MSVVSMANDLVGKVKYSFGANSITSAGGTGDCSSFVQYVFGQNGVSLPRTAESQYNSSKGKSVDKDKLQAGDVVFFQGTYKSGISHVGIYVGNGKFVHNSSSKGGTTISDLSNDYYTKHYAGAKRYAGANTGFSDDVTSDVKENSTSNLGLIKGFASNIVVALVIAVLMVLGFVLFAKAFI